MVLEKMEEEIPNGWDEHFCFNIVDFTPGSAVIVTRGGSRERGVVTGADYKKFTVSYVNAENKTLTTSINSVVLLQDGVREWLSRPL